MAPYPTRKTLRKQHCIGTSKSKEIQEPSMELSSTGVCNSSSTSSEEDENGVDIRSAGSCCTPKGKRYRIPNNLSCPPAPKKPRYVITSNLSLPTSSPVAFYAPPDIDLFFLFALNNI
ncbi:cyclin-dependent protein kinase inhibitor SMR9-like [Cornus florida]|uniref:cyclin-dependent protein kinase inhibitor SMR9-like n=1 Tax=Cornus florida TaxID=4283 RepID=UPI0028990893|nr:cyclin-dependent protein kinase inhibitor SMR9-like [Cornus florida]